MSYPTPPSNILSHANLPSMGGYHPAGQSYGGEAGRVVDGHAGSVALGNALSSVSIYIFRFKTFQNGLYLL